MKTFCAIAISLWLGSGAGAAADDYTGNWWAVWLVVGLALFLLTFVYLRRPAR